MSKPFTPININITKVDKQNKYMTIQSKYNNNNNYVTPYNMKQH